MIREQKDISQNVKGMLDVNEGGVFASQENIRLSVMDALSHSNNLLKLLYYTEVNPLSCPDIVDSNRKYINKPKFDKEIKNKILFTDNKVLTSLPDNVEKCYLTMNMRLMMRDINYGDVICELLILIHENHTLLYDGTSRLGRIGVELNKEINNSVGNFIGTLKITSGEDTNAPSKYRAYRVTLRATDMNR